MRDTYGGVVSNLFSRKQQQIGIDTALINAVLVLFSNLNTDRSLVQNSQ